VGDGLTASEVRAACRSAVGRWFSVDASKVGCRTAAQVASRRLLPVPGSDPKAKVVKRRLQSRWDVSFSVKVPPAEQATSSGLLDDLLDDPSAFGSVLTQELSEVASDPSAIGSSFSMGEFGEPEPDNIVNEALARVDQAEVSLVEQLLAGNATSASTSVLGMTIVAQKVDVDEAVNSTESIVIEAGDDATVEVQPETIASLGAPAGSSIVIVVTPLTTIESTDAELNNTEAGADIVRGAIKIDIYDSEGGTYTLSNLEEPIILTFFVEDPLADCYVWDVQETDWTRYGLTTISKTNTTLVCSTVHLSLFAAIARGFLSKLQCSGASLLSDEGFSNFSKGDWSSSPAAILLWIVLLLFAGVFAVAVMLDVDRHQTKRWRDANFLITDTDVIPDGRPGDDGPQTGLLAATAVLAGCCGLLLELAVIIYEMLSELLAELFADMFEYIGEVQEVCVGLCEGIGEMCSGSASGAGGVGAFAAALMVTSRRAIVSSAHRNACADLGVHHRDAYDDAVLEILQLAQKAREETGASPGSAASSGKKGLKSIQTKANLDSAKLNRLRSSVAEGSATAERITQHTQVLENLHLRQLERVQHHHSFMHLMRHLPRSVLRQLLKLGPLGSCLVFSIWAPSSLRVLWLFCDLFGALMIATLFMEGAGADPSKDNPDECEADGVGELIGQLLAFGVCSAILSTIPLLILGRLHKRKFIRVDYVGSKQWKTQLRVWRFMDVCLWIFGLAYGIFCLIYVMLFMANVDPADHTPWIVTAGTSFASTLLIAPLGMAIIPAILAFFLILVLACWLRKQRHEVLDMILTHGEEEEAGRPSDASGGPRDAAEQSPSTPPQPSAAPLQMQQLPQGPISI